MTNNPWHHHHHQGRALSCSKKRSCIHICERKHCDWLSDLQHHLLWRQTKTLKAKTFSHGVRQQFECPSRPGEVPIALAVPVYRCCREASVAAAQWSVIKGTYVSNFVGVIQVSRHSPRFAIGAPLPEPFFMQLACHPFVHCNSRSLTFVSALKWTSLVDTKAILSAYPSITAPSGWSALFFPSTRRWSSGGMLRLGSRVQLKSVCGLIKFAAIKFHL